MAVTPDEHYSFNQFAVEMLNNRDRLRSLSGEWRAGKREEVNAAIRRGIAELDARGPGHSTSSGMIHWEAQRLI